MFGGFGMTELLVILVIVLMLFGTKKLRTLGSDLGTAIKGFRKAMSSEDEKKEEVGADSVDQITPPTSSDTVEHKQEQKQES